MYNLENEANKINQTTYNNANQLLDSDVYKMWGCQLYNFFSSWKDLSEEMQIGLRFKNTLYLVQMICNF